LAEGEYVEEDIEMHIGTKVGEFSISQRKKISPYTEIEMTLEGDIIGEYKVDSISSNF
jgi:hypothetical protein